MKVAITGASGFIGTKVIEKLGLQSNIKIIALSRNVKTIKNQPKKCIWIQTDYSIESLTKVLQGIDTIIHLAAIRGTQGNIADYYPNEKITENILISMNYAQVKHIIFASSISVYSNVKLIPWKEDIALSPKTLYGISKATSEYLCMYYSKKYAYTYTILRIAQVLGIEEKRKGMMNTFIEQASRKEKLTIRGMSIARRQYIYIEDLASIFSKSVLRNWITSEIINVGMRESFSNINIAKCINDVFQNDSGYNYLFNENENIESSCMDTDRLRFLLHIDPMSMRDSLYDIKKRLEKKICMLDT